MAAVTRWKPPQKAKRDVNEASIVQALEAWGFRVERLDKPCDLLISKRGMWFPAEVKNPEGRDRMQPAQEQFIERHAPAPVPIFRTVEDVAEFARWLDR